MKALLKNLKKPLSFSSLWGFYVLFSTFLSLLMATMSGHLSVSIALFSVIVSFPLAWLVSLKESSDGPRFSLGFDKAYIFLMLVFGGLGYLFFIRYFYSSEGFFKTAHPNNFGDMPMHIQYIRYLCDSAFWPHHPGFPEDFLRYPFGIDLFNALWEKMGFSTSSHLFLTGFICTLVLVHLLYQLGRFWGVLAFFCNGGIINILTVSQGRWIDLQNEQAWKSLFLSVWVTQRGFLWALPAGLLILKIWMRRLDRSEPLTSRESLQVTLLLSGLAFFHLHSYFMFMLVGAAIFLFMVRDRTHFISLVIATVAGLPFLWISTDGFKRGSVVHWHSHWTKAAEEPAMWYWVKNFGVQLFLVPLVFFLKRKSEKAHYNLALFALVLFVLFCNVMLAPWEWDNIKVLLWCYLILNFFIFDFWIRGLAPFFQGALIFLCFFSGGFALWMNLPGRKPGVSVFNRSEIYTLEQLLAQEPKDRIYFASPNHRHPLMYLGRPMFMGYAGHLWSHGYNYQEKEKILQKVFVQGQSGDVLDKDRYRLLWGPLEKEQFKELSPQGVELIEELQDYQFYKLK